MRGIFPSLAFPSAEDHLPIQSSALRHRRRITSARRLSQRCRPMRCRDLTVTMLTTRAKHKPRPATSAGTPGLLPQRGADCALAKPTFPSNWRPVWGRPTISVAVVTGLFFLATGLRSVRPLLKCSEGRPRMIDMLQRTSFRHLPAVNTLIFFQFCSVLNFISTSVEVPGFVVGLHLRTSRWM